MKVEAVVGQHGETVWRTATCGECGWCGDEPNEVGGKTWYDCDNNAVARSQVLARSRACPAFEPREEP